MEKYGWWIVKFDLTLEGKEIRWEDLDECSQEHIANLIKEGYTNGEICMEDDLEYDEDYLKENGYYKQVEVCPHCENENIYPVWDVDKQGFVVICQYCGEEILLCDTCMHHDDLNNASGERCDWHKTECGGKCFRGSTTEKRMMENK